MEYYLSSNKPFKYDAYKILPKYFHKNINNNYLIIIFIKLNKINKIFSTI